MNWQSDDNEDLPLVVNRMDRSFKWNYLIFFIFQVLIFLYWPLIFDFTSKELGSDKEAEILQREKKKQQALVTANEESSFDKVLDTALRYDRQGKRVLAATLFEQLLKQAAQSTNYNKQIAALLPRAADFYSKGKEIPAEQIEVLYQDAYLALKKVHGPDYYDYENVHRGLEKLYVSQKRYKEASMQTRMLLEFYRRYYKDSTESQYTFLYPTTIRLGNLLMAAGEPDKARKVYPAALKMTRDKGLPVNAIEKFIAKTYENDGNTPEYITTLPDGPASMMGARIGLVAPDSLPDFKTEAGDLKSAIESLPMEGIYIEELLDKEDSLIINGYADNNKAIARYMRLIDQEVAEPTLNWIKGDERNNMKVSSFSLKLEK